MLIEAESVKIIGKNLNQLFTNENCRYVRFDSLIVEIGYCNGGIRYLPLRHIYDIRVKQAKLDDGDTVIFERLSTSY